MRPTGSQMVASLVVAALVLFTPAADERLPAAAGPVAVQAMAAMAAVDAAGLRYAGSMAAPITGQALSSVVTVRVRVLGSPPPALVPVFRFYSPKSGTHFYTCSDEERDIVVVRWPDVWRYEGVAYWVNPAANTQPLYRFYNRANGAHFYTASAEERDMVFARWMNVFTYDGWTYRVTPYAQAGKPPVYRFINVRNGSHFYTASAEEFDNVMATWPHIYRYEGIAFWLGQ